MYFRGYLMKKSAFGRGELDGELDAVWAVSRAGAADVAPDWTHPDVWAFDETTEGFVGNGGVSVFRQYMDGVWHLKLHTNARFAANPYLGISSGLLVIQEPTIRLLGHPRCVYAER